VLSLPFHTAVRLSQEEEEEEEEEEEAVVTLRQRFAPAPQRTATPSPWWTRAWTWLRSMVQRFLHAFRDAAAV
jgi:hypothetical protein